MLNFEENKIRLINKKHIKINNIIDIIIKNQSLNNYNSCINSLIIKKENNNIINILNIIKYFIPKYFLTRNINYLLKKQIKIIKLNHNIYNKLYFHYSLLYIFIFLNKFKIDFDKKNPIYNNVLFSFPKFVKIIKILFQNEFINHDEILNILQFFLIYIKINHNDLPVNIKVTILTIYIKFIKKIINIINKSNFKNINKKEYIEKIFKEIITKIFELINDKNNIEYLSLINNFRKEENMFIILRLLKENEEFIDNDTIKIIEANIIELLINNFRKEHLNYFYKIIQKILIKFNNLKNNNDYSLLLKKDFSFLSKINDILITVIYKEKVFFNRKEKNYYCDKGFVFNNKNNNNFGLSIKNVINNFTKKGDHNFCMIFTFLLKEKNKNNEVLNIIISILDNNNKELLSLYYKGKTLYLRYFSKSLVEIKIADILYNNYYSFFLFYDKKEIKISINNNDILSIKENKFEISKEFNINIGFFESNNNKKTFSSFNGIICPIILFYLKDGKNKKDNIYKEIKNLLIKIKNNYYIIGEQYSLNTDYNTFLNYYNLYDEIENKNYAIEIYNKIKNIILYVNPTVIINAFNKKTKIYKDEKVYNDSTEKKDKIIQYTYEFNTIPSLENDYIYTFKDNNIISFFKLNNGINYLILQIEIMYYFILLMKYNNKSEDNNYNKNDFDLM